MNIEEQKSLLIDIRSDPKMVSRRYDEIIALRMFLLDIREAIETADFEDPKLKKIEKQITALSRKWGKKGDCV